MLSNNPPIADRLAVDYTDLLVEVEALASQANEAPRKITSEEDQAIVAGLVASARKLRARVDGARVAEKEPYLSGGREVDSFFKASIERMDRVAAAFQRIADDHARAAALEARRKADEAAAAARAEAQRQREIAERAAAAERSKVAAKAEDKAVLADAKAEEAERAAAAPASDLIGKSITGDGLSVTGREVWAFEITDYAEINLNALRPYLKRDAVEAAIKQFVKFNTNTQPLPGIRIFADVRAAIR